MTRIFPLYILIPELPNLNSQKYIDRYGNQVRQSNADSQRGLLQHFLSLDNTNGLTLSLRYFYDPNNSKNEQLKIYLIFNYSHNDCREIDIINEKIISFIQISNLSVFYNLELSSGLNQCQDLGWVNHIGEALKPESFHSQDYYVPDFFDANKNNNMLDVCYILNRLNEKFLLEITLQVCQKSEDRSELAKALAQMIPQLQQVTSHRRDIFFERALSIYQHYQTTYLHSNLFKYSIKALAQTRSNIRPVLMELVRSATAAQSHGEQDCVEIVSRDMDTQKFLKSLKSTEKVEISMAVERKGWQGDFEDKSIRQPVKPKISNNELGDGSTDACFKPFTSPIANCNNAALPPSSRGEILPPSPSAITQSFNSSGKSPLALIKDLKPLHRYATLEEISGFFRIVIPGNIPVPGIPQEQPPLIKPNAEEIFRKYGHTIKGDRYIVGLAEDGTIVYSDWSSIAHRLVAGLNGSGKTIFLFWVVFQFLYAEPQRQVYVLDPKKQFLLLKKAGVNIHVETEPDNYPNFLKEIYDKEFERRKTKIYEEVGVDDIKELREFGYEEHRILVIVDEAARIENMDCDLREDTERYLQEYATQGRALGIHLIYCTQRPINLIDPQVIEQLDERVIFRVSEGTSEHLLGNFMAARIPSGNRGQGRAVIQNENGVNFVNTPEIKRPKPNLPVSDTLWGRLTNKR
ncbi:MULTISPECIES: FtsK/SpoIIIE domain-containing protein [unclassified Microcoleus]|uniref:FtsK/SpoIIIE domain-containing protein n=1 Tax=unclassified Microcoleus TaxID=2642155 RepID=UPI002FD1AAA9